MFAYNHDRDVNSMHYVVSFISLNFSLALLLMFDVCSGRGFISLHSSIKNYLHFKRMHN